MQPSLWVMAGMSLTWGANGLAAMSAERPAAEIRLVAAGDVLAGKPVEAPLPAGLEGAIRRVEVESGARVRRAEWQRNPDGTLTVLMPSALGKGESARLLVWTSGAMHRTAGHVEVVEQVRHEGHDSVRIKTPAAVWTYHREGAGFASLLDRGGRDWIGWRPGGGAAGEYRGIPNLGECCHPGYTGAKGAVTTVEWAGPIHARLRSTTRDGRFETIWDIFPQFARLTVTRAKAAYWFLYEGTPGGKLDVPGDWWAMADGVVRPVEQAWHGGLPKPEFVWFGDASSREVLCAANHAGDDLMDQFWQMEREMTVWGFGREYRCCGKFLKEVPARFTVGLMWKGNRHEMRRIILSAMTEVEVTR